MHVSKIFSLRRQGLVEEAYEAARNLYAVDKSIDATVAMFWAATDALKIRVNDERLSEAEKIYSALERLLTRADDENGWMHDAMKRNLALLKQGRNREELAANGPLHIRTGIWGESLAVSYLRDNGYVILERDWHSKHRDIDIIAQDGDVIVFVEVKTRRNRDIVEPETAVNYQKLKNLSLAINHYVHSKHIDNPWRFDVITVVGSLGSSNPELQHIKDFRIM